MEEKVSLEARVANLEKVAHAPVDLRPAIQEIVADLRVGKTPAVYSPYEQEVLAELQNIRIVLQDIYEYMRNH